MHILLVDDDAEPPPCSASFFAARASPWRPPTKGNRGLEKALQPGIDLVVLDVMLPGIDGFRDPAASPEKQSPVLMLTARGEDTRHHRPGLRAPTIISPTFASSPPASAPSCAATNRTPAAAGAIETNGIVARPRHSGGDRAANAWTHHLEFDIPKCSCAPPGACFRAMP